MAEIWAELKNHDRLRGLEMAPFSGSPNPLIAASAWNKGFRPPNLGADAMRREGIWRSGIMLEGKKQEAARPAANRDLLQGFRLSGHVIDWCGARPGLWRMT